MMLMLLFATPTNKSAKAASLTNYNKSKRSTAFMLDFV
jgi:hypothetical protein